VCRRELITVVPILELFARLIRSRPTVALALAMAGLRPTTYFAQGAALVPLTDPSYAMIDELQSLLPIPGVAIGQRPYSRREVGRMTFAYATRLSVAPNGVASEALRARARTLVASLEDEYSVEIRALRPDSVREPVPLRTNATLRVDASATNGRPRPVPSSNGLGSIAAMTFPLVDGSEGRAIAHGTTGAIEPHIQIGASDWFAVGIDARGAWGSSITSASDVAGAFQALYARGVVSNVALDVGLEEREWGQGGANGMLLSANARPLPAVSISSDTAFSFPWIFHHLGRARLSAMIADLGNGQNFPGAKLVAYKLSIMPTPRLELGAALLDEMGGRGAPPLSFGERIKDLFPYIVLAASPGGDREASNKIAGLDVRYRFPGAHAIAVYYEIDPDDFDLRRLWSIYWQDSAHLLGATIGRIDAQGRMSLDLQVQRTSLRIYEHSQFTSGVTYRDAIIGDPLGPNALGAYATMLARVTPRYSLGLSAAVEARDASQYTVHQNDAHGNGWRFIRVSNGPRESRVRVLADVRSLAVDDRWSILPKVGVERVVNDDFLIGRRSTYGIASVSILFRP